MAVTRSQQDAVPVRDALRQAAIELGGALGNQGSSTGWAHAWSVGPCCRCPRDPRQARLRPCRGASTDADQLSFHALA
jgi:hypothetical protein